MVGSDPTDGGPIIILDTVPKEIRWYGDKTAIKKRSLMARFSVPAVAPREPVKTQSLDILGLTVGMSQSEAEKVIRRQIKVERVLELKGDPADISAVAESARLYVGEGGTDLVGVLYGPLALEPKVYAVARSLFSPLGSVTQGQVLGALAKKYGPLDIPTQWRWGETIREGLCAEPGTPYNINWTGAKVIEGPPLLTRQVSQQEVLENPATAAEIRLLRRLNNALWGFNVSGPQERCKPSVSARFQDSYRLGFAGEQIPEGDTAVLWSWLFDHSYHYRALADAQKAPRPASPAIDLKL